MHSKKEGCSSHLSKLVEGTIVLGNVVLLQVHNGFTIVHASEGDSRIDLIPGYVAMAITTPCTQYRASQNSSLR